jgi:hypothetical protein
VDPRGRVQRRWLAAVGWEQHRDVLAAEDGVEGAAELRVSVVDEEPERLLVPEPEQADPPSTDGKSHEPSQPDAHHSRGTSLRALSDSEMSPDRHARRVRPPRLGDTTDPLDLRPVFIREGSTAPYMTCAPLAHRLAHGDSKPCKSASS